MRERYAAFDRGDIEGATQDWADDFVWQGPNSTELPGGGEHTGKQQALQVLQQAVGAWDEFKLSADEFLEEGDTVVVLGHNEVSKGGQSAKVPVVHIWRWEGDQAKRLQLLSDTPPGGPAARRRVAPVSRRGGSCRRPASPPPCPAAPSAAPRRSRTPITHAAVARQQRGGPCATTTWSVLRDLETGSAPRRSTRAASTTPRLSPPR
jgi:ketosteroid isomerase-like protein